jgi:hypothetical protein
VNEAENDLFGTVRPLELATYMRAHGWEQVEVSPGTYSVWSGGPERSHEVLVPLNPELLDFRRRIVDAIRGIAAAERRSHRVVLEEVSAVASDLIRVRVEDPSFKDGSIPIDAGAALIRFCRDMLVAAACSATEARPAYPAKKPSAVIDYVKTVRLGQTQRGSFVVTIKAPVPTTDQVEIPGIPDPMPFERRVTATLMASVAATAAAAEEAQRIGTMAPFTNAISQGVNANLCEALAGALEETDAQGLGLTISWAPARPPGALLALPSDVTLRRDALPVLTEAVKHFREQSAEPDAELKGYVIALKRDEGELLGEAVIFGRTPRGHRKVRVVDLHHDEYNAVVEAHRAQNVVRMVGSLRKEGRSFVLRNAAEIAVGLDADDEENVEPEG